MSYNGFKKKKNELNILKTRIVKLKGRSFAVVIDHSEIDKILLSGDDNKISIEYRDLFTDSFSENACNFKYRKVYIHFNNLLSDEKEARNLKCDVFNYFKLAMTGQKKSFLTKLGEDSDYGLCLKKLLDWKRHTKCCSIVPLIMILSNADDKELEKKYDCDVISFYDVYINKKSNFWKKIKTFFSF